MGCEATSQKHLFSVEAEGVDSSLEVLLNSPGFGAAAEKEPTALQRVNIWDKLARLGPGAVKSDRRGASKGKAGAQGIRPHVGKVLLPILLSEECWHPVNNSQNTLKKATQYVDLLYKNLLLY